MSLLVVDVGTSSIRAMLVDASGAVTVERREPCLPDTTTPGLVSFDAAAMADLAIGLARNVAARSTDGVDGVGVAVQRASTVVWDATSGEPVGPGIGWQDLRTVGRCLELSGQGLRVAPNMSATKAEWLVANSDVPTERLRFGTIDSWLAWTLTGGAVHVTDATNAAVTGMTNGAVTGWRRELIDALGLPETSLPTIVGTAGVIAAATAIDGAPPLTALVGDQQASLVGQGCVNPGDAKITFGTGAMLDVVAGTTPIRPPDAATFPIVAHRVGSVDTYGIEAVMLSAGACVEWMRDGLGLIDDVADSATLAASVDHSDGVTFVPALSGLGTPVWDHGARGLLIGLSQGTTRAHVVRAVLEGVAHRGADLIDAAETVLGTSIEHLSVDGGMTANAVFVQALADSAQRPIHVAHQREATGLGAGLLAGVGAGVWASVGDAAATVEPGHVVEPSGSPVDRATFARARDRAARWIPELSNVSF